MATGKGDLILSPENINEVLYVRCKLDEKIMWQMQVVRGDQFNAYLEKEAEKYRRPGVVTPVLSEETIYEDSNMQVCPVDIFLDQVPGKKCLFCYAVNDENPYDGHVLKKNISQIYSQ